MRYSEMLPSIDLRPYVRCMWSMRGEGSGGIERIVPDGCPEIVVSLGDGFCREFEDGCVRGQDAFLVVGQLRTALRTRPGGCVDLVGIRFEPAGLRAVLGCSMRELTDVDAPLQSVRPGVARELEDAVCTPTRTDWVRRVERLLRREIERRRIGGRSRNLLALEATACIENTQALTVGSVASALGVSGRTLERVFAEEIGIGPKEYLRVRRLQRVIRFLDGCARTPDWAGIAARGGYCDQSHLVREFGLIAGISPEGYLREQTGFMDAFAGA